MNIEKLRSLRRILGPSRIKSECDFFLRLIFSSSSYVQYMDFIITGSRQIVR